MFVCFSIQCEGEEQAVYFKLKETQKVHIVIFFFFSVCEHHIRHVPVVMPSGMGSQYGNVTSGHCCQDSNLVPAPLWPCAELPSCSLWASLSPWLFVTPCTCANMASRHSPSKDRSLSPTFSFPPIYTQSWWNALPSIHITTRGFVGIKVD